MPQALPFAITAGATYLGSKLAKGKKGKDDPNDPSKGPGDLDLTGVTQGSYEDRARRAHLFSEAERYAATGPFSQVYGGELPAGLNPMQQAGQRFMADRILGPGAYDQSNIGFTGYQGPEVESNPFRYRPQNQPFYNSQKQQWNPITQSWGPPQKELGPGTPWPTADYRAPHRGQPPSSALDPRIAGSVRPYPGIQQPPGGLESLGEQPMGGTHPTDARYVDPDLASTRIPGRDPDPRSGLILDGGFGEDGGWGGGGGGGYVPLPPDVPPTPPIIPPEIPTDPPIITEPIHPTDDPLEDGVVDEPVPYQAPEGFQPVGLGEIDEATQAVRGLLGDAATPAVGLGAGIPEVASRDIRPTDVMADAPAVVSRDVATPQDIATQDFQSASVMDSPSIEDYMNRMGGESQLKEAEQQYLRDLNLLQQQQAGSGSFASTSARAALPELEALEGYQRTRAGIQSQLYRDAASAREQDIARRQRGRELQYGTEASSRERGRELRAQADLANARSNLTAQQSNLEAAVRTGNVQGQISAQAALQDAQNALRAAESNQRTALQAAELEQRGGLERGRQQLEQARALANLGVTGAETSAALASELGQMGEQQRLANLMQYQHLADLHRQRMEGPAADLSLVRGMLPDAAAYQYGKGSGVPGWLSTALAVAGTGANVYRAVKNP